MLCMYLCMYVWMYVCMYACMHVCMHESKYVYTCININMNVNMNMNLHLHLYLYLSIYIYINVLIWYVYLDLQLLHVFWSFWDLPISKISRTIGNWHAQFFEKCSLSSIGRLLFWIYAWLGLFALDCAYVRPKLRPCFLLQIALRYWKCSLFLILITILDICSKAPKVEGSKKIM